MSVTIKDTDRGLSHLVRRAAELANKIEIGVGVPEDVGEYPDGTPVATVALAHELGVNVPQRSFIRSWFDSKSVGFFGRELAGITQDHLLHGTSLQASIAKFGEQSVREIQERMDEGIEPALQDETVRRKRKDGSPTPETPLEDTHRLRNAIRWTARHG